MVSIWGSKKNAEDHPASQDDGASGREGGRQPDERTTLLPREQRDGQLDPNDPAVSPYNLWSVRSLRWLTILFFIITLVWWVLLLVSLFISPPGMQSRGSGFFDFSYTTLTAGILLNVLLFFVIPSTASIISYAIISLLLFVEIIIILAIPQLRAEEGWVGIASIVWAFVITLWAILIERVVKWGKAEEEERLTGRVESRRTLGEWCGVLTSTIILVIFVLITILLTANLSLRARDASLSAPGQKYYVDSDKYQVHIYCAGNATDAKGKRNPTFFLEGGEYPVEGSLAPFMENALQNGTIARYCYWDRPGFAWSENAPSPLSAGIATDALRTALAERGEEGPWILVSAGIGGIYSRVYASKPIGEVKGLLLIDAMNEEDLGQVGNARRGLILWLRGIISPLGFDRTFGAIIKGRSREDRLWGRSAYQSGRFIKAKLQESLAAESFTRNEIRAASTILDKSIPLVVVSSGKRAAKADWREKQRELTKITDRLLAWDVVEGADHEVWQKLDGRKVLEKRLGDLVKEAK